MPSGVVVFRPVPVAFNDTGRNGAPEKRKPAVNTAVPSPAPAVMPTVLEGVIGIGEPNVGVKLTVEVLSKKLV